MEKIAGMTHHISHIIYSRTLSVGYISIFSDELVFVCLYHASIQLLLHPLFGGTPPSTTVHKNNEEMLVNIPSTVRSLAQPD